MKKVEIEESWSNILENEFKKPYFQSLRLKLRELYKTKNIYPHQSNIFNAFNMTPFDKIKVVIIGQDPYHGPNQAHGLCFSVNKTIKIPPSLQNIFKELKNDLDIDIPISGNLTKWTGQGILLLNNVLTVERGLANSHKNIGWEEFTKSTISLISDHLSNIVFILWGMQAQEKESLIDKSKHLILKAAHPSPLSAYNGFYGCNHFSKTNSYLKEKLKDEINWNLT